jgi:hypothetical protein
MAGIGDIKMTFHVDTSELEAAIMRVRAGLDVRTKCAVASCVRQGLERNLIVTSIGPAAGAKHDIFLYVCDEHSGDLSAVMSEDKTAPPTLIEEG